LVAAAAGEKGAISKLGRAVAVGSAVLLASLLSSCFVAIDVTEYGVFLRFGRVVRTVAAPGLHLKRPYPFETVTRLDRRLLTFKPTTAEYLTEDKKNLVVHSLLTWRIADPPKFLATVGVRVAAEERLADMVLANIGAVVGSHPASALIAADGQGAAFEQVIGQVVTEAHEAALMAYGIELIDVRLRQLSLPEQNRANVFARMQAERGKIALQYRSEGEREFKKVIAAAEREKTRIMAEAYREAEQTKGEGDAEATRIYAEAFGQNRQFYKFLRTLQAYEKFLDAHTTIFFPADAEVFRILNSNRAPKAE
jgi:modulator of FtsH protease HflC